MTDNMSNMPDANELLDRAKELAQRQSVLIETLLQTVAQRNEALAKFVESGKVVEEFKTALNKYSNIPTVQIDELFRQKNKVATLNKKLEQYILAADKSQAALAAMTRKAEDAEAAGWRMRQELDMKGCRKP